MKCPVCYIPMIAVEYAKIELDYCVKCSGVWFDAGELALLLESVQLEGSSIPINRILTSPQIESSEKKRRCPICGKKMRKATLGHNPEITIDACPQEDGLWFDKEEISQLIGQLPEKAPAKSGSQGQVIAFLGDVFKAPE